MSVGVVLVTHCGLGEQFLKIWTPEPEQENRRVTLRRLTALLSDYDGGDEEDLE